MTNTTPVFWSADGVSLQTYANNIVTWGGDRQAPPLLRGSDTEIPFAPGQRWMPKIPDSRIISMDMWVIGANADGTPPTSKTANSAQRALFESNWRAIRNLLCNPRRQIALTKQFQLFGDSTIYSATAMAQYSDGLNPQMQGELSATFTVDLLLSDPYFYGSPITLDIDPLNDETNNYTIVGDDRTRNIVVTIPGHSTRLRIHNESAVDAYGNSLNLWMEYDYENPTGQTAQLDVRAFTANQDIYGANTPVNGSVSHQGDAFWMFLDPGPVTIGAGELDVPTSAVEWTNLATNPSFETSGSLTTQWQNNNTNPSQEAAVQSGTTKFRFNLCVNPNFTTNTANWGAFNPLGGTVSIATSSSPGIPYPGTVNAMKVSVDGTKGIQGAATTITSVGDAGAGHYQISCWVLSSVVPISVQGSWYAADGVTEISSSGQSVAANSGWQSVSFNSEPSTKEGTTYLQVSISTGITPPDQAVIFYVSSVLIEKNGLPGSTQYFDGNSTGLAEYGITYAWSGTANASSSYAQAAMNTIETNQFPNPSFEYVLSSNTITTNVCSVAQTTLYSVEGLTEPAFAQNGVAAMITPTSATVAESYFSVGGDSGGMRLGLTAGATYSLSATMFQSNPVTGTASAFQGQMVVYWVVGGVTTSTGSGTDANTRGNRRKSMTFTVPSGATAAWIRFFHGGTTTGLVNVAWDQVTLVQLPSSVGSYTGEFFDGDTASENGYYHVWTNGLSAKPTSTAQRIGRGVVGVSTVLGVSTTWQCPAFAGRGLSAVAVAPGGANSTSFADITAQVSMAVSKTYLIRGKIHLPFAQGGSLATQARSIVVTWSTGVLTPTVISSVPNLAGDYEYVATVTTPSSGTLTSFVLWNGASVGVGLDPQGMGWVAWDDILCAVQIGTFPAITAVPYFDGASLPAADAQFAWSGSVDASASLMLTAPPADGTVSTDATVIQSTAWALDGGTYSCRIIASSATLTDSYFSPLGDSGALRGGMAALGTYTAMATIKVPAAQTGTLDTYARSIVIGYRVGSGSYVYTATQAPNVAGVYPLSVTVTLPTGTTEAFVRLYNGDTSGKPDMYWDEFLLIKNSTTDPYLGSYFDGNTLSTDYADYAWTGTPNHSTSTVSGLATAGPVTVAYQPVWI